MTTNFQIIDFIEIKQPKSNQSITFRLESNKRNQNKSIISEMFAQSSYKLWQFVRSEQTQTVGSLHANHLTRKFVLCVSHISNKWFDISTGIP